MCIGVDDDDDEVAPSSVLLLEAKELLVVGCMKVDAARLLKDWRFASDGIYALNDVAKLSARSRCQRLSSYFSLSRYSPDPSRGMFSRSS